MNSVKSEYEITILMKDGFAEEIAEGELNHLLEYLPEIYKDMIIVLEYED